MVSTVTKCVLFNASTHDVLQVGKKQREGSFGACFHMRWQGKPPVVYSARPGRLWEADAEGTVLSTLRLKELITTPATPLLGYGYVRSHTLKFKENVVFFFVFFWGGGGGLLYSNIELCLFSFN